MKTQLLGCALLAVLLAGSASAQQYSQPQSSSNANAPTVDSIIDQLKVKQSDGINQGGTRSLELGSASQAVSVAQKPAAPASISVKVTFDFNSDRISGASSQTVANLASALASSELQSRRFRIVGHTDGVGSAGYNLALSKRRAASVRSYLVQHGVDASRLSATGVGMQDLANAADPSAAENRRVVVEATGG